MAQTILALLADVVVIVVLLAVPVSLVLWAALRYNLWGLPWRGR